MLRCSRSHSRARAGCDDPERRQRAISRHSTVKIVCRKADSRVLRLPLPDHSNWPDSRARSRMKINLGLVWAAIALTIALGCVYAASTQTGISPAAQVNRVLAQTPLIDGHNDLAWQIRDCFAKLEH